MDSLESALGAEFLLTKIGIYDIISSTATRESILEALSYGKKADSLRRLERIPIGTTKTVFVSRKI